ncbi:hypothetical protein IQ07DRAFT_590382 [Pyrenochaeta sp. DS3sAY3a]|nr:hypothetical protein IQ07DRAFT_590382 [Pyrenochaeta sp. DS3sAY3a]
MTNEHTSKPLKDLLAEQLPKDVPFTFHHYSTPPTKSSALFSAPPHGKSERTYCESHFLAASITQKETAASALPVELLILAIEVLIYTTRNLTTIFVSKADSTGYLSELQLPRSQAGSPLKVICGTFVSWLARERQREGKKLVISLFARAQDQYLFPASIENKKKHVLDDRGLVRWWCKVLDPIIWQYKAEDERKPFAERLLQAESAAVGTWSQTDATAKGYLVIPGFDPYETLRYIPQPSQPNTTRRWASTHPLLQIAPHPAAPPRCLVPHFPDDPKSRFLDELDEELPDRGTDAMVVEGGTPSRSNGQWKSVKTLDQFWEFMAFRQECSSGRIVGFIWVVITPPQPSIPEEDEVSLSQQSLSQTLSDEMPKKANPSPKKQKRNKRRQEPRIKYGPIPLVLPKIKTSSSNLSATSNASSTSSAKALPEKSPYYSWPINSRGTVCFSARNYNRAHEVLLQQSFANRRATAQSTKKWKEEIGVLGGMEDWSWTVIGKKEESTASVTSTNRVMPTVVMGVRKKRKPDAESSATQINGTTVVQTLGEGLVRKKAKIEPLQASEPNADGVNMLSANLVRKKGTVP